MGLSSICGLGIRVSGCSIWGLGYGWPDMRCLAMGEVVEQGKSFGNAQKAGFFHDNALV